MIRVDCALSGCGYPIREMDEETFSYLQERAAKELALLKMKRISSMNVI